MTGLVVDLFAGGGGASVGIEAALGRSVDIAINHDPIALAVHRCNHRGTNHLEADIWEVRPRDATGGHLVDLLWASPDCFPAGTMILARDGYRLIEEIAVGDEVLTHEKRWRRVTATMTSVKPLVRLRGHGHPGLLVSPEHPFFARTRWKTWNNEKRVYDAHFSDPTWMEARELERDLYWASPTLFPIDVPPEVPVYFGRSMRMTADLMWLAGLYVADGWTRLSAKHADLVITCGRHEAEGLRQKLGPWRPLAKRAGADELSWQERDTGTAHQFTTAHRGLVEWLRANFGHGAAEKRIPGWALGMSSDLRQALLSGYLSGDGCRYSAARSQLVDATTVSKALAFGIKALASSLGKTVTVYFRQNNDTIQGRKVNAHPSWSLRWRDDLDESHRQTVQENGLEWSPVRERTDLDDEALVYNLSVEEDESYVADGIVVHNCTHFSIAKGDVPRSKQIRSLAWVVVRWARDVRPVVVCVENVQEFKGWGPLGADGRPDKARMGQTFRRWVRQLERLGYAVDWRVLDASQYGAPTRRRRLFIVARCDGLPIEWPAPTHGPGLEPLRTAAECIDWSLPCPSIFERKRPLADKTLWRIAQGIRRFVLETAEPFIVQVNHGRWEPRHEPLAEPLSTVTATQRGHALVAPTLVQTGYGERPGQRPRAPGLHKPLGTLVDGQKHALVSAFLSRFYGGPRPVVGGDCRSPLPTVTAWDHNSLAAVCLAKFRGTHPNQPASGSVRKPLSTISAGGIHVAEVRAFLTAYYGTDGSSGQRVLEPARTVTAKHRLGLVTVSGVDYQIVDIGLRMLQPHELLRAQFGRYAESYDLSPAATKAAKVRLIGNSVCPEVAEAVVRANTLGAGRVAA